jgi:DNA-binding response OmpR family regulator
MNALIKPKILLVDDDARYCELLVRFLRQQDFDALSVESGQAMTQRRRLSHFDLLLLDLHMPDEDGLSIS